MSFAESQVKAMLVAVLDRYAEANRLAREAHDLRVCGLEEPGPANPCPGCRTGYYRVEAQRAAEEFYDLSCELGDLFLSLFRHTADKRPGELIDLFVWLLRQCFRHRTDDLRGLLVELLAPDLALFMKGFLAQRNGHAK